MHDSNYETYYYPIVDGQAATEYEWRDKYHLDRDESFHTLGSSSYIVYNSLGKILEYVERNRQKWGWTYRDTYEYDEYTEALGYSETRQYQYQNGKLMCFLITRYDKQGHYLSRITTEYDGDGNVTSVKFYGDAISG